MKKTYITPTMETVKIAARNQMLTESNVGLSTGNATEWGSRGSDDWDDED